MVLTDESFPRLSVVAAGSPTAAATSACLGPFPSRVEAGIAVEALQTVVRIRRCSQRIRKTGATGTPCVLAELGKCGAPCSSAEDVDAYALHSRRITELVDGVSDEILQSLRATVVQLGAAGRFEEAAAARDRLAVLAGALDRRQRLRSLTSIAELVAARPDGTGGWELSVVRSGRLAAAGRAARGVDPMPVVALLQASAETVRCAPGPLPAASAEETSTILRWLDQPGTRLVDTTAPWEVPAAGGGRWRSFADAAAVARGQLRATDLQSATPLQRRDRRRSRTAS